MIDHLLSDILATAQRDFCGPRDTQYRVIVEMVDTPAPTVVCREPTFLVVSLTPSHDIQGVTWEICHECIHAISAPFVGYTTFLEEGAAEGFRATTLAIISIHSGCPMKSIGVPNILSDGYLTFSIKAQSARFA